MVGKERLVVFSLWVKLSYNELERSARFGLYGGNEANNLRIFVAKDCQGGKL